MAKQLIVIKIFYGERNGRKRILPTDTFIVIYAEKHRGREYAVLFQFQKRLFSDIKEKSNFILPHIPEVLNILHYNTLRSLQTVIF